MTNQINNPLITLITQVFQERIGWLVSILIIRVRAFSVLLHSLLHFGPSTADRLGQSRSFEDEQGSLEPVNESACFSTFVAVSGYIWHYCWEKPEVSSNVKGDEQHIRTMYHVKRKESPIAHLGRSESWVPVGCQVLLWVASGLLEGSCWQLRDHRTPLQMLA